MKKLRKVLLISVVVLLHSLATGISFTIGWRPFIGPKKRAADNPPVRTHTRNAWPAGNIW